MLDDREREELRRLVREFLADRSPEPAVRAAMDTEQGFDPGLWAGLGADGLGVCGLAVPVEHGGDGHSFAEVAVVLGELGRALACVPYLSSVVLAQQLLLACPGSAAAARWLPRLASGEARAAVAVVEASGRWEPGAISAVATPDGARWRLTGTKPFVVDGHTADVLFVAARTPDDGVGIFEVDRADVAATPLPTLDLTRTQATVELDGAPARLVAADGWAATGAMLRYAAAGLAAESVGGMRRVLEMSVEYAGTRTQFGRPIGAFQAVKHRCADMLLATESADALVRDAVLAVTTGSDGDAALASGIAHAFAQDAYLDCAAENIQVHGGIGFTWEHPAQLYYKRAQTSRLLLGDPVFHRALAAARIGL